MSNKMKKLKFVPRIINPIKIKNVVILSADEQLRKAHVTLEEYMSWIEVQIFPDPITASNYKSDFASVFIFDDTALALVDPEKIKKNNHPSSPPKD